MSGATASATDHAARLLLRQRIEEFLIEEAALLDEWRLDDWFELFTEDARYVVPTTDLADGDPSVNLTLIDDDHLRLQWRVNRLKSRHAHREFPWSRTRRQITNVRVVETDGEEISVEAGADTRRDHEVGGAAALAEVPEGVGQPLPVEDLAAGDQVRACQDPTHQNTMLSAPFGLSRSRSSSARRERMRNVSPVSTSRVR